MDSNEPWKQLNPLVMYLSCPAQNWTLNGRLANCSFSNDWVEFKELRGRNSEHFTQSSECLTRQTAYLKAFLNSAQLNYLQAKAPECGLSSPPCSGEEFLGKQMAPVSDICIIRKETHNQKAQNN
ncbi:hypothetical protein PGT21_004220 [Puccinia graminis f. sp. tritici]|uniref:Uncharacterized protein n=1 Tax=Puccinia graminis f. sp. tritici TaxID=56615 RepID=A0A5B0MUT7_PUCGR|nr:hypothetical protein PGT21_004220 [Puccinia graminis f. sp. tritici]KAA1120393.1 hypothetical protein PGTUg99_010654 [Puccinia graminis f. sp. tritici]